MFRCRTFWIAVVLVCASTAWAQASFTPLIAPPGQAPVLHALGVSADGSTAVGVGVGPLQAYRWTEETGIVPLTTDQRNEAYDTSGDGSVVVGIRSQSGGLEPVLDEAFRWTEVDGFVGLGDLPGGTFFSRAVGVSDDGSVIAGRSSSAAGSETFLWTAEDGMVGLGDPPDRDFASPQGISADGTTVVGCMPLLSPATGTEAFYWTEAAGFVGIGHLGTASPNTCAMAASADGSVIVGQSTSPSSPNGLQFEAFVWTPGGGMVGIADLPGGTFFQSFANDVSGDGSIVVGEGDFASGRRAFVWDEVQGMQPLQHVLQIQGVDMTGWHLTSAQAVSADGSTIVGYGSQGAGLDVGFVAVIPEPGHGAMIVSGVLAMLWLRRRRDRQPRA